MANKRLYLSNLSAAYGPAELYGVGGARALVLGRAISLEEFADLRNFFSMIVSEDQSYSAGLVEPPDVEFWQSGSPYVQSVFSFPTDQDVLYCVNFRTLKSMSGLQYNTGTYNLAYLGSGEVSAVPSTVRGLPIGLDPLAPGVHLATIMGALELWDTEGRAGTMLATKETISGIVKQENKYGVSPYVLGQRLSLIERL